MQYKNTQTFINTFTQTNIYISASIILSQKNPKLTERTANQGEEARNKGTPAETPGVPENPSTQVPPNHPPQVHRPSHARVLQRRPLRRTHQGPGTQAKRARGTHEENSGEQAGRRGAEVRVRDVHARALPEVHDRQGAAARVLQEQVGASFEYEGDQ